MLESILKMLEVAIDHGRDSMFLPLGPDPVASFLFNLCSPLLVPFKEAPKFNPRRRTSNAAATTVPSSATLASNFSSPRLQPQPPAVSNSHSQPQSYRLDASPRNGSAGAPSSPSPSDRSLPPFSSGSSISETTSTGSGSSSINPQQANGHREKAKSLLQQSLHNSLVIHEDEHLDSASALAVSIANGKTVFEFSRVNISCKKVVKPTDVF